MGISRRKVRTSASAIVQFWECCLADCTNRSDYNLSHVSSTLSDSCLLCNLDNLLPRVSLATITAEGQDLRLFSLDVPTKWLRKVLTFEFDVRRFNTELSPCYPFTHCHSKSESSRNGEVTQLCVCFIRAVIGESVPSKVKKSVLT